MYIEDENDSFIKISYTDANNNNLEEWLKIIKVNDIIKVVDIQNTSTYAFFLVKSTTDKTTYIQLSVTLVSSLGYSLTGLYSISYIMEGPHGPQGLTGQHGPQGLTGQHGPQGLTGPHGPQGQRGQQGPEGLQGLTGPIGGQGPPGQQGPTGPTGPNPWILDEYTIVKPTGTIEFTGIGYTGNVGIFGDLIVTGTIDPIAVYLTNTTNTNSMTLDSITNKINYYTHPHKSTISLDNNGNLDISSDQKISFNCPNIAFIDLNTVQTTGHTNKAYIFTDVSGVTINSFLKITINGSNDWIPYFTVDPSP
jgi:hypothetical protein